MPSSPTSYHLRSLYRSFLRELPQRAKASTPKTTLATKSSPAPIPPLNQQSSSQSRFPLHTRLRHSFSAQAQAQTQQSSSPPSTKRRVQEAQQFLLYLRSQRMYATLLERYNPGIAQDGGDGRGVDEMVRLTARRVGMEMPKEWYGRGDRDGDGEVR